MSNFIKNEVVEKLAQCMGIEKATEVINSLSTELGFAGKAELSPEEMVKLCERMEQEGGFMKMMGSVLKIQAVMALEELPTL